MNYEPPQVLRFLDKNKSSSIITTRSFRPFIALASRINVRIFHKAYQEFNSEDDLLPHGITIKMTDKKSAVGRKLCIRVFSTDTFSSLFTRDTATISRKRENTRFSIDFIPQLTARDVRLCTLWRIEHFLALSTFGSVVDYYIKIVSEASTLIIKIVNLSLRMIFYSVWEIKSRALCSRWPTKPIKWRRKMCIEPMSRILLGDVAAIDSLYNDTCDNL